IDASERLWHASLATRWLFAASLTIKYAALRNAAAPGFGPRLIVANNRMMAITADKFTREAFLHAHGWDDRLFLDDYWILSAKEGELWKAAPLPSEGRTLVERARKYLLDARSQQVINLGVVFRDIQSKALKLLP